MTFLNNFNEVLKDYFGKLEKYLSESLFFVFQKYMETVMSFVTTNH